MPRASENASQVAARIASATGTELEELCERYADDPRKQVARAIGVARRRAQAEAAERDRVSEMYRFQRDLAGGAVFVGVDEVGRGPLAGPLTVCAIQLPDDPQIPGLNDSKQLSAAKREHIAQMLEDVALAIGIAHIEPASIDALGMAACLRMAVRMAIEDSGASPACVLLDGNPLHAVEGEINVVKGDAKCASIAAASIYAKVARDAIMVDYDEAYPEYQLARNKGYASPEHIEAIRAHGLTPIHRTSFCGNFIERPRLFD